VNEPCDKIHSTGEESGLSNTEHDTADDQTSEVLYEAGEGHDDAPGNDQDTNVC